MSFIAVGAIAASAVVSSVNSSRAAGAASAAASDANATNQSQFNQIRADNAPYREAGKAALSQMQDPSFQRGFTQADFHQDPGYQFALKQGNDALSASQAAQGNNISGAGLAALDQYNQGMANQDYQQAFNNFNQTQNQNYSRLSTLANLGAGGNAQSGAAGENYANAYGNNVNQAGSAQAQALGTQSNAFGSALSQFGTQLGKYNATQPQPTNDPYTASSQNGATVAGGAMDQMMTPEYGGVSGATA